MSLYKNEHPEYLRLALDSMINQTEKPDEIVLVEDGPLSDELYAVVEEYKNCLHIVVNKNNLGLGLALNQGLKACRNEIVARMDTDDISVPDRCEKQLKFLGENPDTTIIGGQIEEFISTPKEIIGKRTVPEKDIDIKNYMKKRCPFNHMTVMFRKTDIIEAGNYQDWFWNEDYYLWIRLACEQYKFGNLPDTLVYTRVGHDMYRRRGGWKYFISEFRIQKLMYKKRLIGTVRYVINVIERFIIQIMLPNSIRGYIYRKFARS